MLTIATHVPSPALQQCELTFVNSTSIDFVRATRQHEQYCNSLEKLGARVITLADNRFLPDCSFVEDPIIVFDEVAVLASMGVASRRKELPLLEKFFSSYRPVKRIQLPAKIEGGDVLKIGTNIFVGQSARTNKAGAQALATIIEPLGYEVIHVKVSGCLHLKTGCTALDNETVLINSNWIDTAPFGSHKQIETLPQEPFGANVLPVLDSICMNSAASETIELVRSMGYE
ncbi:MAG: dimethylarginine dimethylaminohydrolase family protein, partial [Desulfobulbia bacterium]